MDNSTYYNVKLNNGDKHIVYESQDVLEAMVKQNIISEYILALDNWSSEKIYENYIYENIENKVHEICANIQEAKNIKSGDCPPDLAIDLDKRIESLTEIIMEIISFEEYLKG